MGRDGEAEPTSAEWTQAKRLLDEARKTAVVGELGGFRPADTGDRLVSWWGGNFVGLPGEAPPVCRVTGHVMQPVLQVRVDELPHVPKGLEGIALLGLWVDLKPYQIFEAESGEAFCVRTYRSLDGLIPVGPGYREHPTFPVFPVRWTPVEEDLPDWEEFVDRVPRAVARSRESSWFFDHPGRKALEQLQKDRPIKIGGYPQWWQSPQDVDGADFILQLDSNRKGQLSFYGGTAHFFHRDGRWLVRTDMT